MLAEDRRLACDGFVARLRGPSAEGHPQVEGAADEAGEALEEENEEREGNGFAGQQAGASEEGLGDVFARAESANGGDEEADGKDGDDE